MWHYTKLRICCSFFFFKQKTAYEMRISDWSSDVCSSDLPNPDSPDTVTPAKGLYKAKLFTAEKHGAHWPLNTLSSSDGRIHEPAGSLHHGLQRLIVQGGAYARQVTCRGVCHRGRSQEVPIGTIGTSRI